MKWKGQVTGIWVLTIESNIAKLIKRVVAVNGKIPSLQDLSSQHFGLLASLFTAQIHPKRERETLHLDHSRELNVNLTQGYGARPWDKCYYLQSEVVPCPFWYPGWGKTWGWPSRHKCNEHRNSSPRRITNWGRKYENWRMLATSSQTDLCLHVIGLWTSSGARFHCKFVGCGDICMSDIRCMCQGCNWATKRIPWFFVF